MEEVLASHADVAECAVTGIADSLKGEVPVGLLVDEMPDALGGNGLASSRAGSLTGA